MLKKFLGGAISLVFAITVLLLVYYFKAFILGIIDNMIIYYTLLVFCTLLAAIYGLLAAPAIIRLIERITDSLSAGLSKISLVDIFCSTCGLIAGLIIASLLGGAFSNLVLIGPYMKPILSVIFGYLGMAIAYKKRLDLRSFLNVRKQDKNDKKQGALRNNSPKILDTSVIIDGRIADIFSTGFIEGELIIPNFVLEELRHIADSGDPLKRTRGRRGLDILNKLRTDFEGLVVISEADYPDIVEVDSKLLKLAQDMQGVVMTNDFNLNKVAQLQQVKVLNINELANSVRQVFLPGEELLVQVVKDGSAQGQGIAYLDDGTMIVVEGGKRYINKTLTVVVTSILQTTAGRMIFAKPKFVRRKGAQDTEE